MKVLVVVDMQEDFVDGCLGTAEAKGIVSGVVEKISSFPGRVFYTMDTHGENYPDTQEGRKLPVPHCIKDSQGWNIIAEIRQLDCFRQEDTIDKRTFGSVTLGEQLLCLHNETALSSIELIGVCTDICVISNALLIKAYLPEVPIIVHGNLCAGVTPASHENALQAMAACQIEIRS